MSLQEDQPRAHSSEACAANGLPCKTLEKFSDPDVTLKGEARARVPFGGYKTIWFNTGTLCNITCVDCYIESSPRNDRLVYLSRAEVKTYLDEAGLLKDRPAEIGFTGGEPFLNPHFLGILEDTLTAGFRVLILTNAMKPMQLKKDRLLQLRQRFSGQIHVRVSIDHYTQEGHEKVRGRGSWPSAVAGLRWLSANRFDLAVAGRMIWQERETSVRTGYRDMFASIGLSLDADNPADLVLFPEMSSTKDVPEISEGCWNKLGKRPSDVMCSNSRMVVKRKGDDHPVVVACTILPYEAAFEIGGSLAEAKASVRLNHNYCARFCVLGGASCSVQK